MNKKIICLLLCAVMLCTLCACGKDNTKSPATDSDIPTAEDIAALVRENEDAALTPVPENIAAADRGETAVLKMTDAEGKTVSFDAELLCGTFTDGPSVSLYGEKDSTWSETEEGYIFALPGVGPESACAMEMRFLPGKTADELAPGLLDEFDDIRSMEDMDTVILAGRGMRCVRGSGEALNWTAWILDLPEGAVALVMCAYPEAESAVLRMEACIDTLEIVSNY